MPIALPDNLPLKVMPDAIVWSQLQLKDIWYVQNNTLYTNPTVSAVLKYTVHSMWICVCLKYVMTTIAKMCIYKNLN